MKRKHNIVKPTAHKCLLVSCLLSCLLICLFLTSCHISMGNMEEDYYIISKKEIATNEDLDACYYIVRYDGRGQRIYGMGSAFEFYDSRYKYELGDTVTIARK